MNQDYAAGGGMDYIHPRLVVTNPKLAALLPEGVAREHNVLPQGKQGRVLQLLIGDPHDFKTMDLLRFTLAQCSTTLHFTLTSPEAIRRGIDQMYGTPGP